MVCFEIILNTLLPYNTNIDLILGCAVSGLIADSRTMVERARAESQNHWFTYDEQMSVESVAQAVSNLAIQFSGDYDSKEPAMVKKKK